MSDAIDKPIVVGVDGSASGLDAALWAADMAAQRNHRIRLVHACDFSSYAPGFAPPQSYFDEMQADGVQVLADVEAAILRSHPELRVVTDLVTAAPVGALIEQSDDARLLVVGSRGDGGLRGVLVGSTAVALVAHAHCPVAVIRGPVPDSSPPTSGSVVVGIDGSPTSEAAVATAFDEASWRGADLVALHSWMEIPVDRFAYRSFPAQWDAAEENGRELLAERLAGWQEKYPDVTVRHVLPRGRPVDCLLEYATDARMLVVGSRGHGGFAGMVLGSTSQALIYHAPCPVMVVRPLPTG